MSGFSDSLRTWLRAPGPERAELAERAQPSAELGSARSASSARSAGELSISLNTPSPETPAGFAGWTEDARDTFIERLGIATDLGMDCTAGSPAWTIAQGEALSVLTGRPITSHERLAWLASSILGVPVWSEVAPIGHRFACEPDWRSNPLVEEVGRLTGGSNARCRACGRWRWWRLLGQASPTCGACHPPTPGLAVEWLNGGNGRTP